MLQDMLMFNLFNRLKPCYLCGEFNLENIYPLCTTCWKQLEVNPRYITKQEVSILVAAPYQFPLDRMIQKFKYNQALHYTDIFKQICERVAIPKTFQAIVPMPISKSRLHQRGYNQAYLIAQILSAQYNLPIWMPIKRNHEQSQKGLSRIERLIGIEAQFQLAPPNALRYRKVLIVDDVVTTGGSILALKQKLHTLGCHHVEAFCIASA
ncbi:ComF family protein [Acinetobacter nectaris]|uniref:ComF family protein n=2 Tax=Acinetobacter nectaris TaxID=1219382 RepID=UPI001F3BB37A|nr:phosphoribosyltransferase family protein [Acinetobacter nectaris]MCF8998648.1 ComF family protein [Acinetobacter nectaris]MCF9027762.1 ComF family protein [Acinetobacter nectaris]